MGRIEVQYSDGRFVGWLCLPAPGTAAALHGGLDRLVTEEEQRRFLAGADTATRALRVRPDGEHTLYSHAAERHALTADWFTQHSLRT